MAGVDRDRLAGFQVPHLQRAVTGKDDRALAFGADDEATLATEQVLEATPLGVERDVDLVAEPRALLHEQRVPGRDLVTRDIAWEACRDVDEATRLRAPCTC